MTDHPPALPSRQASRTPETEAHTENTRPSNSDSNGIWMITWTPGANCRVKGGAYPLQSPERRRWVVWGKHFFIRRCSMDGYVPLWESETYRCLTWECYAAIQAQVDFNIRAGVKEPSWQENSSAQLQHILNAEAFLGSDADVAFWHEADIKLRPLFGRYGVESGL